MRMKAFPTLADNGHITTQDGMDLRDYFAAKIMQAIISSSNPNENIYKSVYASWSYEIADAMMEARGND
jgi:hypothetical protein